MIHPPAIRRRGAAPLGALALAIVAGCTNVPSDPPTRFAFTALEAARIPAPEGAPPGSCWARDVTPAVIETRTEQLVVQKAVLNPDGSLLAPAIYATETRQDIVEPRREYTFQTLCAQEITPEFVASLQRALQARGRYDGPITGVIDPATEAALRRLQAEDGLDTGILTLRTARMLGLAAVAPL